MAPKGKGKANKLAKMSEEERQRYLQHRADIEEEAKRRKHELISRYMKIKLQKEDIYAKVNLAKINQQWRFLLRRIKCKQMAKEIEGTSSSFTEIMARKDRCIAELMVQLDEAEDQYIRMFQSQMEMVNTFLELGIARLEYIQNNYVAVKSSKLDQWDRDYQDIEVNQESDEQELNIIVYQQQDSADSYTKNKTLFIATKLNDERLEQEETMHIMRLPRELELEGVWNQVKNVFRCYVDNHSPMIKQYTTLRKKDEFARRVISKQSDKIASATVINSELQEELIYLQTNKEMKTNDYTLTKGEMSRGFHRIKQKLEACNALDQKQLRFLVENSEKSIKCLQSLISKSEQATQIAEACYKYEKQEEIKYFRKQNKDKLFNISMDFEETEHLTEAMIDDYQVLERMANFWFKLNSVKINVNMLKVEKQNLRRENEELKASLKKYLTEVALADCRYQPTHRPVSMYTYSSTTKAGEEMADKRFMFEKLPRPVTCIEANTCNAVQHERRQKVWNQRNNKQPIVTRSCW